jgi:hypothetical protein
MKGGIERGRDKFLQAWHPARFKRGEAYSRICLRGSLRVPWVQGPLCQVMHTVDMWLECSTVHQSYYTDGLESYLNDPVDKMIIFIIL